MDARALLFIIENPGTRPTALRDYLGITSAGVTTLVDRLISRDIVRRDVDVSDRRVNRISATIDIADEPWSALRRFDEDFDRATTAHDPTITERFAALLKEITLTAVGRA
jgi:DNA-binding MarR family transcriptional regulator